MPSVYHILSEFTSEKDPDSISVQPFWMIAVVRFAKPLTFSRSKMFADQSSVSYDANSEDLIKERSPLVIVDDVLLMHVEHSKNSYISSLQATLMSGQLNYLQEIQPNDWVFAWIHNDETKGRQVLDKVLRGAPANAFDEGLKFVGRVQSIRKKLTQSPDGQRTVRYMLTAAGFKELDATVFFDPNLSKQEQSIGQFLTELNVNLDDVFADADKSAQGLTTTKIVPRLMKLLLGEGVPPEAATLGPVQIATGGTSTPEAPYAYAVPTTVLSLLGQTVEMKQIPSFSDVMELVVGIQKYRNGANSTVPSSIFSPDGAAGSTSNHRILNDNLLGSFLPLPIAFTGKSVWSFLEEFKNPAVNEMYTALRINPEGRVVPTVIVRQLPFSTQFAMTSGDANVLTAHLELPRWYAHPILINSLDVGKSDALHLNFIHVYGQASAQAGVPLTHQIVANPPVRDEQDIKRSGLRMHMQTVNCSIADTLDEPKRWMKIAADFLIGQQYTLTGSCEMIGITAPICPGDCFEFDDTVYHIEAVSHSCAIAPGGMKQFNTTLSLTHGMRTDTQDQRLPVVSKESTAINGGEELIAANPDLALYTGMKRDDALGYDPGQSIDSRNDTLRKTTNPSASKGDDGVIATVSDSGVMV